MKRLVPLILLATAMLMGCATPLRQVKAGSSLSARKAYIAGRLREDRAFLQFTPATVVRLRDGQHNTYRLHFSFGNEVQILEIPPGEYLVSGIIATETRRDSAGQALTHAIPVELPAVLLAPFRVGPGQIVYLGDLVLKKRWYILFTTYVLEQHFAAESFAADLKAKFGLDFGLEISRID